MLEAVNIHKNFNSGRKMLQVLRGVSVEIDKGKFVAIVGPSGAGKSTLLHILGGLDSPSEGSVSLEKKNIYKLSDDALSQLRNKRIGFVFQFYHLLFDFTVLENVLMPGLISGKEKMKLKEDALRLLGEVGLNERSGYFPAQLSGGEKQRVAIARALINSPDLLLCDEPTGNLDSKTGEEIINLIKKINANSGMTVVMVTHNQELAKLSDKVYHLRDGILN